MATADRLYRRLLAYSRFFSKGWGPVDTYEKLLDFRHVIFDREGCAEILRRHPQRITVTKVKSGKEAEIYNGEFHSPLAAFLPGLLPKQSEVARFEMVLPTSWRDCKRPVYIHLAGTGDHYFWRRRVMTVMPTLRRDNIGAVSLENPFYGSRKPPEQTRSQLQHVSDLFVLGLALILECMVIMHWLEGRGLGPVGLTGFSMGGHNCSLAAALWPKPVAVVPCLSWSTASSSFTDGLLSRTVAWDVLEEQLLHCQSGTDGRRRECLRRIRELETKSHNSTTDNHHIESESSRTADNLWNNDSVLVSRGLVGERITNSVLHSAKEVETERGWARENMPKGSDITVGLHGMVSYLVQRTMVGFKKSAQKEISERCKESSKSSGLPRSELLEAMRMVLDLSTHHQYFPVPLDPSLAHFVAAEQDAYIPRAHITDVCSTWPGCEVEYIAGGHISTTILQQTAVHKALNHTIHKLCWPHL